MYKGYVHVTFSSACTTFLCPSSDVSCRTTRALVILDH